MLTGKSQRDRTSVKSGSRVPSESGLSYAATSIADYTVVKLVTKGQRLITFEDRKEACQHSTVTIFIADNKQKLGSRVPGKTSDLTV